MKTITTHCALRLGDNLAHLHFLRKLAEANPGHLFEHHAQVDYLRELAPMAVDRPIKLFALPQFSDGRRWSARPAGHSIDAWKNAGGRFERADPPSRNDYARFMLDWFDELAGLMGLRSPLTTTTDLLFDYPALHHESITSQALDFLIVNSRPMSGQARQYSPAEMDRLIVSLRSRGYNVLATNRSETGIPYPSTQEWGFNVTQIGQLSQVARRIIMVSTGPSWPTFNVWNRNSVELRVIINGSERVELDPRAIQTGSVVDVCRVLGAKMLL